MISTHFLKQWRFRHFWKLVVSGLSNRVEDNINVILVCNENTGLKTYPPLQISIRNTRTHNSLSARETPG
jgi:hypothetical protein